MVSEQSADALTRLREALSDPESLVRAVASGGRKGAPEPQTAGRDVRRVELRYVDLKAGRHLQVESFDATQAHTANHLAGPQAEAAVAQLIAEPFANWHVETATRTLQARTTKRGELLLHSKLRHQPLVVGREHDRDKQRLLAEDDPVLIALGISDAQGRVKPTRRAKYRQVEEFCRLLDAAVSEAIDKGHLRRPTSDEPLRVVDLGCGNAYLTFAAHRLLTARGLPVRVTGVDVKQQSADHNTRVAAELGIDADFAVGSIVDAALDQPPDVVLALHACDTATDDALARALEWDVPLILAAPCCHHDLAAQLRRQPTPVPYAMLTRDGILRERLADTLTDAVRAQLLRLRGYRVDVVEFVGSEHTPRNTMLRATRVERRGGSVVDAQLQADYDALVADWQITPRLAQLIQGAEIDVPAK